MWHVPSDYKLRPDDANQINDLLKGAAYIYPKKKRAVCGHCVFPSRLNTISWQDQPDGLLPFNHPAVVKIISNRWFKSKVSLGAMHPEWFESSIEEAPNELEIPKAMAALAATVVSSKWHSEHSPDSH
jgi:hypothetical protein